MRVYVLVFLILLAGALHAQKPAVNWNDNGKTKSYFSYKVEQGDNLSRIAHQFGVTVKAIQKANPALSKTLPVGAILHIPIKKGAATNSKSVVHASDVSKKQMAVTPGLNNTGQPVIYIVKQGDTYASIIRDNNIQDKTAFDKQNNLQTRDMKIGQKLIVGYNPESNTPTYVTDGNKAITPPAPDRFIAETKPTHNYRTDTATLTALSLEDCGSDARYVFTSEYPLGTHLVLVNTANNKNVAVTVTAEKPELKTYSNVQVLMSCAAAHSLDYTGSKKPVKVLVTK